MNNKYMPPARCRLVEWAPQRRYQIEEIIGRLGLERAGSSPEVGASKLTTISRESDEGEVFLPPPAENAVVTALKAKGLYKQQLAPGKHDITCPWVHEHTDATDHGTVYFEPAPPKYTFGGFRCQHSHGDRYRLGDLLQALDIGWAAARHRPQVRVVPGELHRVVEAGERLLADSGRYYQRGGVIVTLQPDPQRSGDAVIKGMTQPALSTALSRAANWLKYDRRSEEFVPCDPPPRCVSGLDQAERYEHLPTLHGVARQPHLSADGGVVREAGFDTASGLFGTFDASAFAVPANPTRADALQALHALNQLLQEFPFESVCDRAAALAAIITAAVRPSLPLAPMFHVRAPQIASGKSYLTALIAAFAAPRVPGALAFPTSEEECAKLLLATLMEGAPTVVFDNLTEDLRPFKALCSALTEPQVAGRILGVSKTVSVSTRALFMSSGNNVGPIQDMARRCVTIALDPKLEIPAARRFSADPLAEVRASRGSFVSHALIIAAAFAAVGRPRQDCRPVATFTEWDYWVRQPLIWLGLPDPATRVFEQLEQDPSRELVGHFLVAVHRAFGSDSFSVRILVEEAEYRSPGRADVNMKEVLAEIGGERGGFNRRRIGRWLARHADCVVDGLVLRRAAGTHNVERWHIKSVSTEKSVSTSAPEKDVGDGEVAA